jgi:hypothetical protein
MNGFIVICQSAVSAPVRHAVRGVRHAWRWARAVGRHVVHMAARAPSHALPSLPAGTGMVCRRIAIAGLAGTAGVVAPLPHSHPQSAAHRAMSAPGAPLAVAQLVLDGPEQEVSDPGQVAASAAPSLPDVGSAPDPTLSAWSSDPNTPGAAFPGDVADVPTPSLAATPITPGAPPTTLSAPPLPIAEPASGLILGAGGVLLFVLARRRARAGRTSRNPD